MDEQIVTDPTVIQDQSVKQPKSKKIIFLILLAILTLVIAIISILINSGILLQKVATKATPIITSVPTQNLATDSTASWKTFNSLQYKYSMKYPSSWFIKDLTSQLSSGFLEAWYFNDSEEITLQNHKVSMLVRNVSVENSKKYLNYGDGGLQNKAEITPITVDGKEGIGAVVTLFQYDGKTGTQVEDSKSYQVLIPLGDNSIWIVSDLKYRPIVDQMLSTFKFTDQEIAEEKVCGGFAGETGEFACPTGYRCKYTQQYPDAQGTCVKK